MLAILKPKGDIFIRLSSEKKSFITQSWVREMVLVVILYWVRFVQKPSVDHYKHNYTQTIDTHIFLFSCYFPERNLLLSL